MFGGLDFGSGEGLVAVALLLPGFVSTRIYEMLIPTQRRDFSKSVTEFLGYSAINYLLLGWAILPTVPFWESGDLTGTTYALLLLIVVVFPVLWPIWIVMIAKARLSRRIGRHPLPATWDFVFNQKRALWVIAHLRDGRRIGGFYGENSFANSYPEPQDIYLEQIWTLDAQAAFGEAVPSSAGALIKGADIEVLEFKQAEP